MWVGVDVALAVLKFSTSPSMFGLKDSKVLSVKQIINRGEQSLIMK